MRYFWTRQFATALMFGCMASTAFAGNWTVVQTSADAKFTTDRSNWKQITPGMTLPDNSWVNTGKRGRVTIQKDTNVVNLNPGTLAGINELGGKLDKTVIAQQTGSVTLDLVHKSAPWMTVQTPFLAAVVKGTRFNVTIGKTEATVDVSRGRVGVTDPRRGETVDIVTGQRAQVDATSLRPMKVAGVGKIAPVVSIKPTAPVVPMTPSQSQAIQEEQKKAGVDPTDENKKIDETNKNDNVENPGNTDDQKNTDNKKQDKKETDNQNGERYQNNHNNDNQNENENDNEDQYKKKYQKENQSENKYQKQSYNTEGTPAVQESSVSPDIGYSRTPMSGFKRTKTSSSKTSTQKKSSAASTTSHSNSDNRPVTTLLNNLLNSVIQQSDAVQSPAPSSNDTPSSTQTAVQSSGDQSNGGSQTSGQTSSNDGNSNSQSQQQSSGSEGNSGSQSQTASSETDQTKVSSTSNSDSDSDSKSSSKTNTKIRQFYKRAFKKMRF